MTNIKAKFSVGGAGGRRDHRNRSARPRFSAPIVITYEKTCVLTATPTCTGTTGDGDTLTMQITGFRPTGKAANLTFTESIVDEISGEILFTAEMKGNSSPAGFIVLNGTVTEGPFAGRRSTSEATS